MQKYLKYFLVILLLCSISLPWSYNYLSKLKLTYSSSKPSWEIRSDRRRGSESSFKLNAKATVNEERSDLLRSIKFVRIGVVSCGLDRLEETLTMVKSSIISAMRFHLETLELIVFADDDLLYPFDQKLSVLKHKIPKNLSLRFRYEIHPLIFPPGQDTQAWLNLFRPCATQRLFLPSALPHINELIYVDTDVLITGDLREIWSVFQKMNSSQHTALVPEHEKHSMGWYNRFAKHPYYPPLGVNSGVMLMNLSRLRTFDWERKAIKFYQEYKKDLVFGDQDIINIIFHYYPESLLIIPCSFNYRPDHCIYGKNCLLADESEGIKLLHGNRRVFRQPSKVPHFETIYSIYRNFDLSTNEVTDGLVKPLKTVILSLNATQGNSACKDLSQLVLNNFL